MRTSLISAIGALAFSGVLLGQTARLEGRVTDPTGTLVPQSKLVVINSATGVKTTVESNEDGYYTVPVLPPGTYQITVQKEGFKSINRTGVEVLAGDKLRIDFVLELGALTQSIDVAASAPLLGVSTAESSASITGRQYDNLPLLQIGRIRNPSTFVYLTPGVQGNVSANGADYTGATNVIQINGSQSYTTEQYVDGLPAGRPEQIGSLTEAAPSVEAVREFNVQSSQMSAEYGRTGAGVVSFTIKSGTNEPHGSAYEYLRNDKLDARPWLASYRSAERQNEFGVSLGAPVFLPKIYNGKDRTFFFFNYGASRSVGLPNLGRYSLATPAQSLGDFSANVSTGRNLIYDPSTTRPDGKGGFIRDQFPGNIIPTNRIAQVAANIAKFIPAANLTGAGNINFQGLYGDRELRPTTVTAKVDHTISNVQTVSSTFNYTSIPRWYLQTPLPFPMDGGYFQEVTSRTARFRDDYVIRPNLLNELVLGYNRFRNPETSSTFAKGVNKTIGLTGLPEDASFPNFSFTNGYSSFNMGDTGVNSIEQTYMLKDSVTWTHGAQIIKAGAEIRRTQANNRSTLDSRASYNFSNLATALPGSPSSTGDGFASFLLGQVQSASLSLPLMLGPRYPYYAFFVQDDVKLTPRLSVNLGLRFEFSQAPYEAADRYSIIDLSAPNPGAGNVAGALVFAGSGSGRTGRRTLSRTDYSALGPRVGASWRLNDKTVVRGGYGLYYSSNYLSISSSGFSVSPSYQSLDNGITPPFLLQNGFPQDYPRPPFISPAFLNGQGGTYYEYTSGALPRTANWSLGIQRELSANLLIELNYIGTHGTRQVDPTLININQVDPKYLSLGPLLTQSITSAGAQAAGIPSPYPGFTGSVAQALRAFPQYQTLTAASAKAGNSTYNAAEVGVRKRLSAGFSLLADYRFSKNIGYGSSPSSSDSQLQDNFNRALERAILPIDLTHALVLSYVYDLPLGPGRKFAVKGGVSGKLLGGWTISGSHRYQSGVPLIISMNNSLPIFNRVLRPNLVAGQPVGTGFGNGDFQPNTDRVINRLAFTAPAAYHFGNAPRAIPSLRNFPVLNEDLALTKATPVNERVSVEAYCQFVNAFNRHRFSGIDSNMSNSTAGMVSGTSLPRRIQVGLRLRF